jgi:hypothetical protein
MCSFLPENHKIQQQDHGLADDVNEGTRAIDHHLIAAVISAVSGKNYSMKATFPYGHEVRALNAMLHNRYLSVAPLVFDSSFHVGYHF